MTLRGTVRGIYTTPQNVTRVYVRLVGVDESVPDTVIYTDATIEAKVGDDVAFVIGAPVSAQEAGS